MLQIWLGVGISIVCVIFVLKFLQRYQEKLFETAANHGNGIKLPHRKRADGHYLYVFGNLMSQGNERNNRLLANVWKGEKK